MQINTAASWFGLGLVVVVFLCGFLYDRYGRKTHKVNATLDVSEGPRKPRQQKNKKRSESKFERFFSFFSS